MRFSKLLLLLPILSTGISQADTVLTGTAVPLTVGADYAKPQYFSLNGTAYTGVGAGNFNPNTLAGEPLPYMYCVDILHTINAPGVYSAQVNTIGYIVNDVSSPGADTTPIANPSQTPGAMNPPSTSAPNSNTYGTATLANAGDIGYLMVNFAPTAANNNQELALQAAIWSQVYGSEFVLNEAWYLQPSNNTNGKNYAEVVTYYDYYLSSIPNGSNSGYIDDVLWINPYTSTSKTNKHGVTTYTYTYRQGQVGYVPTPLPGSLAMALSCLGPVAVGAYIRRHRKPAQAIG